MLLTGHKTEVEGHSEADSTPFSQEGAQWAAQVLVAADFYRRRRMDRRHLQIKVKNKKLIVFLKKQKDQRGKLSSI